KGSGEPNTKEICPEFSYLRPMIRLGTNKTTFGLYNISKWILPQLSCGSTIQADIIMLYQGLPEKKY
ncbi:MAG: hypothetical protein ACO3F3_11705, partial [Gemmataceae bacterium]